MTGGSCPTCGANYHRRDFSTDWLGRVVLDGHCCDPKAIARFQQPLPAQDTTRVQWMANCCRCGQYFRAFTKLQKYCVACATERRRARDRTYKRDAA